MSEKMKNFIIITLLYYCILKADSWDISIKNISEDDTIPTECTKILYEFADCASNLTTCSIVNARPIRLCAKCVEYYIGFRAKFREIHTTAVNGTSCASLFISNDRLNAVKEIHDSILSIWNKGHCDACFDWSKEIPVLSNNTIEFIQKYNETMECMNKNLLGNDTNKVCIKCMHSYVELNEIYKSLSIDAIGVDSICMDVVDLMNITRSIWSKTLNCCKLRKSPEIIFLCCTAVIAMLPIIYYFAVAYCGPIRDLPNVLKQSRFKQMILRSQERIN